MVPNDTNKTFDVFVRDTVANTTTLVSVNDAGTGAANALSGSPVISSDGRYVTFQSARHRSSCPARLPPARATFIGAT